LAAMLVFWQHTSGKLLETLGLNKEIETFGFGAQGVSFFFVLSGFLTFLYFKKLKQTVK